MQQMVDKQKPVCSEPDRPNIYTLLPPLLTSLLIFAALTLAYFHRVAWIMNERDRRTQNMFTTG